MEIVEIRIRPYQNPTVYEYENLPLNLGHWCVIEHDEGEDLGVVVRMPSTPDAWGEPEIAGKIIRIATPQDREKRKENKAQEAEAFKICKEKIKEHDLPMKLVMVESLLDRSKLKFYFTSEQRVDFRELVRDLAHIFKTRIELRQIGVRDESKILDGYGVCGQRLCCASFLRNFDPITIKMAKNQDLALNPSRLSGVCGRLKCCLAYEDNFYSSVRHLFPKTGNRLQYENEEWVVESINMLKDTVFLRKEAAIQEVNLSDIPAWKGKKNKSEPGNPAKASDSGEIEKLESDEKFEV